MAYDANAIRKLLRDTEPKSGKGRKSKADKEGGGWGSLFSSVAKTAVRAAPQVTRIASTVERGALGVASAARTVGNASRGVSTLATRSIPTVGRLAPTSRALTTTSTKGTLAAEAAAKPSLISTIASRGMTAANIAALGLGIGMPVYQILQMQKDAREQAALQAKYDKEAEDAKAQAKIDAAKAQADNDAAVALMNQGSQASIDYYAQLDRDAAQAKLDQDAMNQQLMDEYAKQQNEAAAQAAQDRADAAQAQADAIRQAIAEAMAQYGVPQTAPPTVYRPPPSQPQQPYVPSQPTFTPTQSSGRKPNGSRFGSGKIGGASIMPSLMSYAMPSLQSYGDVPNQPMADQPIVAQPRYAPIQARPYNGNVEIMPSPARSMPRLPRLPISSGPAIRPRPISGVKPLPSREINPYGSSMWARVISGVQQRQGAKFTNKVGGSKKSQIAELQAKYGLSKKEAKNLLGY